MLDDYASMARAALALFEASGEPADLDAARRLASEALELFGDGKGGVYLTASDAADVPGARPRHAHDGATPSGVGLLMEVFARLWHLTDEARWREAAEGLINAFSGAPEGIGGSPLLLMGADMLDARRLDRRRRAARRSRRRALAAVALAAPDPSLTVLRLDRRLWPNGSPRDGLPRLPSPPRCSARARPAACRSRRPRRWGRCSGSGRREGHDGRGTPRVAQPQFLSTKRILCSL